MCADSLLARFCFFVLYTRKSGDLLHLVQVAYLQGIFAPSTEYLIASIAVCLCALEEESLCSLDDYLLIDESDSVYFALTVQACSGFNQFSDDFF